MSKLAIFVAAGGGALFGIVAGFPLGEAVGDATGSGRAGMWTLLGTIAVSAGIFGALAAPDDTTTTTTITPGTGAPRALPPRFATY